jgi:hypothetical protein
MRFLTEVKAKEPDFKPSCYYNQSTKAREINDSIEFQLIIIDLRNCLNGLQNIDVSRKC